MAQFFIKIIFMEKFKLYKLFNKKITDIIIIVFFFSPKIATFQSLKAATSLRIQSEWGKIFTIENSEYGHFSHSEHNS